MLEARQRGSRADRLHVGKMLCGIDAVPDRGRHMDRQDSSVCVRTADERDFFGSGEADISDILPAPAQKSVVLLAQHRSADPAGMGDNGKSFKSSFARARSLCFLSTMNLSSCVECTSRTWP